MGIYKNVTVTCPDCGKSFKMKRFYQIDPYSNPDQRNKILSDNLFEAKCPYCRKVENYPYSFTYYEKKADMYIHYSADEEDQKEYMEENKDEKNIRVVANNDSLVEKIMIFHEGFDDRIMEVAKHFALEGLKQNDPTVVKAVYLYNMTNQGAYGSIIAGYHADNTFRSMVPADDFYRHIQDVYGKEIEEYESGTLIVDAAWADAFLKKVDPEEKNFQIEPADDEASEIAGFFNDVDSLYMQGDEKAAAERIEKDFDRIWNKMLEENPGRPKIEELDDKYEGFFNASGELGEILLNENKYQLCMHVMQTMLDTIDMSDDSLMHHNAKRAYSEALGEAEGFEKQQAYLEEWKKEEPGSAYVAGAEIQMRLLHKDLDKAKELAYQYIDMPLKEDGDDFLLDACMNVGNMLKDQELLNKAKKARQKMLR